MWWAAAMGDAIGIGPPHLEEGKAGTSRQSQSKRHNKSCSNCKQLGHTKKTCQRSPVASSVRGKGRGTGTGMGQANHVKGMERGTGRARGNANATTSMVPLFLSLYYILSKIFNICPFFCQSINIGRDKGIAVRC